MANQRDMRNIRERYRNGGHFSYEVRLQRKNDYGKTVTRVRTFWSGNPTLDLANAIKWRDQQKSKADLGELGEKLEEIEAMQEPLKTLVVRYMASRFLTTKKTARKEWRSMQTLLEHPLGSRLFNRTIYEWSKEGRKFLREYIDHRLSSPGVSLPGVMRELSPIQHLFNIARTEWGY